ncbi:MAG: ABC transporter permease, partial [Candidatus Acidiferrum sp.]
LVGAGLLMESLLKIRSGNPGFSTHGVVTTTIDLAGAGYDEQRAKNFDDELMIRVQALPGVESAALSRMTPLGYRAYSSSPIAVGGYQVPPEEQPTVEYNEVGPHYFVTMGIPLVTGREFTRADDENAALVAVVNETMAAQFWKGKNPLGARVQVKGRWMRVVGVARDSKYESIREQPKLFFYVPLRQNFAVLPCLNVRTSLAPAVIAPALARAIRSLDGNLAPYEVIPTQELVDRSTSPQQAAVTLLGVLGGLALVLAVIGLYGVMSYAVSQNTRELGLRMALGANSSELLRLVMKQGLALTACGVALGTAAALGSTRLLGDMLYQVSPRDPLAFGSAFAAMVIASTAACLLPAWRAARTDTIRALREG